MKRKFWSVALALCLCLTLLPGMARAEDTATTEQFDPTPGGTYYFDLSGEGIPGTVNIGNEFQDISVPDDTLHYVPFTYVGTINAYVLNSTFSGVSGSSEQAAGTMDSSATYGYTYDHSLFIADHNVTHMVSWNDLNTNSLIFGSKYPSGGINYTMRAMSTGDSSLNVKDDLRGSDPTNNEWDVILDKSESYIKNGRIGSWGQDSRRWDANIWRVFRGWRQLHYRNAGPINALPVNVGYRPVLELPSGLASDSLNPVTLNLNGGHVGTEASLQNISIIVKNGENFTAPTAVGLTAPAATPYCILTGRSDGMNLYAPGASVPASVTTLTAHWTPITYTITYNLDGGTNAVGNPAGYTYSTGITSFAAPSKAGYTLETLTVTDKDGSTLPLTDKGGGKYTFTMPGSAVTVTATFMEDNAMLNFFVDVPAGAYYYDALLWAAENGITGGTDAVHFSPDASCTRAQIVTFLWRAAGSPVVNYAMDFSDVSGDDYYAEAVRWAASLPQC